MNPNVSQRQYARDQSVATRRANPPRGVTYDVDTGNLNWSPPAGSLPWTHYNIRITKDSGPVSYQVPAGSTQAFIPSPGLVKITAWNDISRTESAPVYYTIAEGWSGGAAGMGGSGPILYA